MSPLKSWMFANFFSSSRSYLTEGVVPTEIFGDAAEDIRLILILKEVLVAQRCPASRRHLRGDVFCRGKGGGIGEF